MIDFIIKLLPRTIIKIIKKKIYKDYLFIGWNMKTKTCPPWKHVSSEDHIYQIDYFQNLNHELINLIKDDKFKPYQINSDPIKKINELKWRHYNICLSIKYLKKFNKEKINLAEAGVADGLTSWFTINCLNKENIEYQDFFLIDSWEPMKKEFLEEKEIKQVNRYKENSIDITKKNLNLFKFKFKKGFIPNVYKNFNEISMIDWLHIDLNSSRATKETLLFFSNYLNKNSIILFDDYGWPNHELSRIEIDKWTMNRKGLLWPLPTGQAIFFNF